MKYLIATSHDDEDEPETITGPMEYDEAAELFEQITGYEAPRKLPLNEEHFHGVTTLRQATLAELVTEEDDGSKNLDLIIEEFSEDRFRKAWDRAERIGEDEDTVEEQYYRELVSMAIGDLLNYQEKLGRVRKSGVKSTGDIDYESLVAGKTVSDLI